MIRLGYEQRCSQNEQSSEIFFIMRKNMKIVKFATQRARIASYAKLFWVRRYWPRKKKEEDRAYYLRLKSVRMRDKIGNIGKEFDDDKIIKTSYLMAILPKLLLFSSLWISHILLDQRSWSNPRILPILTPIQNMKKISWKLHHGNLGKLDMGRQDRPQNPVCCATLASNAKLFAVRRAWKQKKNQAQIGSK